MRREDALAVRGVEVGYARGSVPPGHGPQRARRLRLRVVRRRRSRGVGGACARAVPAGEVVRVPPRRHLRRAARERLCAQDARARRGRDARSAVARRRRWARRDLTRVDDARRLAVGSRAVGSAPRGAGVRAPQRPHSWQRKIRIFSRVFTDRRARVASCGRAIGARQTRARCERATIRARGDHRDARGETRAAIGGDAPRARLGRRRANDDDDDDDGDDGAEAAR